MAMYLNIALEDGDQRLIHCHPRRSNCTRPRRIGGVEMAKTKTLPLDPAEHLGPKASCDVVNIGFPDGDELIIGLKILPAPAKVVVEAGAVKIANASEVAPDKGFYVGEIVCQLHQDPGGHGGGLGDGPRCERGLGRRWRVWLRPRLFPRRPRILCWANISNASSYSARASAKILSGVWVWSMLRRHALLNSSGLYPAIASVSMSFPP